MCGRYTLAVSAGDLADRFGLTGDLPDLTPRYNVAPTQQVAAVLADGGGRKLEMLRWGLVPSWAKDPGIGARMINARGETVAEKPSFRSAFKRSRCLIPADGFYEWQKAAGGKQPFHIRMRDGSPFAFAGLWERWDSDGEELLTCAIITTSANEVVGEVHDRMPVILPEEDHDLWLDPDFDQKDALTTLLKPYPAEAMEAYAVSRFVNRPGNDDERCIERAA